MAAAWRINAAAVVAAVGSIGRPAAWSAVAAQWLLLYVSA
jgi:hypothetical protein